MNINRPRGSGYFSNYSTVVVVVLVVFVVAAVCIFRNRLISFLYPRRGSFFFASGDCLALYCELVELENWKEKDDRFQLDQRRCSLNKPQHLMYRATCVTEFSARIGYE